MVKKLIGFLRSTILLCGLGGILAAYWLYVHPRVETLQIPVEVERDYPDVDTAIDELAAAHHVPSKLIRAIAHVESGTDDRNEAIRYEPGLLNKFNGNRELASSYGVMQVLAGFHVKKTCPQVESWADLVGKRNIQLNIDCGIRVLLACVEFNEKKGIKNSVELVRRALVCYNGDEKYANRVLVKLGEIEVSEMMS